MGLNDTPSADRVHIAFFGKRNSGKSSLVNAVTNQDMAVVSNVKGTTTDPVTKAMELLPLGPVVIIDTPGFDDDDKALGALRVKRTKAVLNSTDIAVLTADAKNGLSDCDRELIELFKEKSVPYIVAYNKCDLGKCPDASGDGIFVSAKNKENIDVLKERIARLLPDDDGRVHMVGDIIKPKDFVILVTPIDSAAPKGRMILPQQQAIRDVLDSSATAIVVKETELSDTLLALEKKPSLVVCDSQVFDIANAKTPPDIKLTSFSILMAKKKGLLESAVRGVRAVENLRDGDTVLISEGCTHHRQCEDIGSVKIPRWLREYTGRDLNFEFSSGKGFPEDLSRYSLIIHCGGCMLSDRTVQFRMKTAEDEHIPITNYGILIAYIKGILKRSIEVFPELSKEL
ncbi:MAG: [FeFe] hydrogenase H-cluster maturation GTPase HydF [Firmicutes bacterium]|nr:[FeFe] hydrogenase H-cluster maturation GTPase HydF [Bacillota bacterium]